MENPDLLTAEEVANLLRVHPRTVQRLSKQGRIRAVKIGNQWRYRKADVENYYTLEPERRSYTPIERRTYPRINCVLKCRYSIILLPYKTINDAGVIRNISAGGVCLFTEKESIKNHEISDPVELDFYLISRGKTENIKAEGRIVRKDNNALGIKFRNLEETAKDKIIQFVG